MQEYIADITGSEIVAFIAGTVPVLAFMVVFTLFAVWLERKVSAHMQDRLGPMRVGYHGALQTLADFIKLLQKEDIVAEANDRPLFNIAPYMVFVGTLLAYTMLPYTSIYIGSSADVGIFFVLAVSGFVVAGILMAGWGSNNKYALLGAFRAIAQMISYEVPMVLALLVPVLLAGSLRSQFSRYHQQLP